MQGILPLMAGLCAWPAAADPWLAPGDARLRHDLQLLADAGIVRTPLTAWPVSWAEVARDVRSAGDDGQHPEYVGAALARVRVAAREATRVGAMSYELRLSGSGNPMALRRFGDVAREEGELSGAAQFTGHRFAYRLQATAVADAGDGQEFRPDGSYVAMVLGNWMLSAGYIDRWWGPGWEGSLILGTNARPLPAITIERNYSDAIDHPWLGWLGQFRAAITLGQLEHDRNDAPDAQFFGMRFTWKPHSRLEVGLSRSAQWCGEGRPCDLDTFRDLLLGRDNDQSPARQPGNQIAGVDMRWSMPWAPVAVYMQAIGEDEANSMPSKYLGLAGVETWGGIGDRSWRAHLEYADTACAFYESEPQFGCAYQNRIYSDGYQYRHRSLGHAIDGDSRQWAGALMLAGADGSSWEIAAQHVRVNRAGANEVHSVAAVPTTIRSADLHHRRTLLNGDLRVGIGYEQTDPAPADHQADKLRGYMEWSVQF
jgi:hypothetical protein